MACEWLFIIVLNIVICVTQLDLQLTENEELPASSSNILHMSSPRFNKFYPSDRSKDNLHNTRLKDLSNVPVDLLHNERDIFQWQSERLMILSNKDLTNFGSLIPDIDLLDSCMSYLYAFSKSASNFVECSVTHARPFRFCEQCVTPYTHTWTDYLSIRSENHTCSILLLEADRIQILTKTANYVWNLWNDAKCGSCFTYVRELENGTVEFQLQEDVEVFLNLFNHTAICFNDTKAPNQSVCVECMQPYIAMNTHYKAILTERKYQICMDIVDIMNYTRLRWSTVFHCSNRHASGTIVLLITGIFALFPIIFYIGNRIHGVRYLHQIVRQKRMSRRITFYVNEPDISSYSPTIQHDEPVTSLTIHQNVEPVNRPVIQYYEPTASLTVHQNEPVTSLTVNQNECVTSPRVHQDECVTSPKVHQDECVTSSTVHQDECITSPTIQHDECVTSPTIHQDECVTSPTVHQDERVTSPTIQHDECVTSPTIQHDELVTSPTIHQDECVTSPTIQPDECITSPTIQPDECVTSPTIQHDELVTSPKIHQDESVTSPTVHQDKRVTSPTIQHDELATGPTIHQDERVTNPTVRQDERVTSPIAHRDECVTSPT